MVDNSKPPTARAKAALRKAARDLLPGEELGFSAKQTVRRATDEELNVRYVKGDVRIVTESARYSLAGILQMLRETVPGPAGVPELRYKLDPEYQRRHRWSDQRKSRLIESFLMNIPVPPVFLYERDLARFEVMDGRQRLTALSDFYANRFKLTGLEYWGDLNGRTYADLPSKVRDGIDRRYISSIILLKETAADEDQASILKKIVFERLNSGGVELSSQETRNAVYNGPLNRLCIELSANAGFRRLWAIPAPDPTDDEQQDDEMYASPEPTAGRRLYERMEDVELVLRFFAYRQIEGFASGLNRISAFLDLFLAEANKSFNDAILASYRTLFETTVEFLASTLGEDAYTTIGLPRARPTKIVYDSIMWSASNLSAGERATLNARPEALRARLVELYGLHRDLFAGRRTNPADAQERDRLMQEALASVLALPA